MNRIASPALLAGMLAALAPAVAQADPVNITNSPFPGGTTTNYTSVGTHSLPFTNADGSTVSATNSSDQINTLGLMITRPGPSAGTDVVTFSGLPTGTNEVGFAFNPFLNSSADYLLSAEFIGPGGFDYTFVGGPSYTLSTPYVGFNSSTNSFTTVILSFHLATAGDEMTSYTSGISTSSVVPEPSSLALCGIAGLVGLVAKRARRKRIALPS